MIRLSITSFSVLKHLSRGITSLPKQTGVQRRLTQITRCRCRKNMSTSSTQSSNSEKWTSVVAVLGSVSVLGGIDYFINPRRAKKVPEPSDETPVPPDDIPAPPEEIPIPEVEIPEHIQYLLIGAGTASLAAFQAIKAKDRKAQVLVIGKENHTPYSRPPLSKSLWYVDNQEKVEKMLDKENGKIYFEPEAYYFAPIDLPEQENGGVAVLKGKTVVKLDGDSKTAYLNDGRQITYDKCLIATGAAPKNLPVFENASKKIQDRVIVFRTIEDYKRLDALTDSAKSVVVVGGGFLGSELACALGHKGKKTGLTVNQIFPEKGVLGAILPLQLSLFATSKVRNDENVNVVPEVSVKDVDFESNQVVLTLTDDSKLKADQVVVAVGVKANTDLAETAGLEVDRTHGGYLVNSELEARSNIWVAGDAACFYDKHLGRRRIEHYDHAMVSGRLAGQNMTGSGKQYTHQSMFWCDLGKSISLEAMGEVHHESDPYVVLAKDTPVAEQDKSSEGHNLSKGVVLYRKKNRIVGVLTWNLEDKMDVARRVIHDACEGESPFEVAKLFDMHKNPDVKAAA